MAIQVDYLYGMTLISEEDFARAVKLDKLGLDALSKPLMKFLRIEKINSLYAKMQGAKSEEFIDEVFRVLEIDVQLDDSEWNHIPDGPFIAVANHPIGGIEGLILLKILLKKDPEAKVMANFLLGKIEPIASHIIAVNPFESSVSMRSSVSGMKQTIQHIQNGHPVGIFPAGEVSTLQLETNSVMDKAWSVSVMKIIRKMGVPVVPVYFRGSNSLVFHALGMIHPLLRTAKLPSELFNKKNKIIQVRIGLPSTSKEWGKIESDTQLAGYFRAKTYALDAAIPKLKWSERFKRIFSEDAEEIVEPVPEELITEEIQRLPSYAKLVEHGDFEVYLAESSDIENSIREIGRLREITFRQVGEGTNMPIDLDTYDPYYKHLILWDKESKRIAGAYRIGIGSEIMKMYGKRGFYIYSLFKIADDFNDILSQSLEFGRSFIVLDYQKKPYPLFLLWKGILEVVNRNPQAQYLIGPVSISSQYTTLSRKLIVEWMKKNNKFPNLSQHIKPRHSFRARLSKVDINSLTSLLDDNISTLDQLVKYIEANHTNSPVLLKKYLKQGASILEFNVDKDFNNALDGFIFLDKKDISDDLFKH